MKAEIISMISLQRQNGITWDQIQKNIFSNFNEEYTIQEIRKTYLNTSKNKKENKSDNISSESLSFDDDDPHNDIFIEEPINNKDDTKKDISLELTKLHNENTFLRKIINDNDKKYKNDLDATINKIDKLNEELEKIKEDNKFLEDNMWRNAANDFALEHENKGFANRLDEKDKEIDSLKRFRKVTYYIATALISSGIIATGIKIGWNYYLVG
jgi:hypothetical protein